MPYYINILQMLSSQISQESQIPLAIDLSQLPKAIKLTEIPKTIELPEVILDKIMSYIYVKKINEIKKINASKRLWLQKKDKNLLQACKSGNIIGVQYLIEHEYEYDYLAICIAAEYGHIEIVKYLFERGADIRIYSDMALRYSAQNGHLQVVKYLIENGAYVHAINDSSLCYSAENGHLSVVEYLLYQGADIH